MINDKEINDVSFMLQNSNINENNENENGDDEIFIIDNNISYIKNEMKLITKIDINFYQLWSLLGELPILQKGHSKYEWRFIRKDLPNVIFRIYDWNNQNNFLNTKVWYLGSTTTSSVHNKEFLYTFINGIDCYNTYYKKSIQTRDFYSDCPIIYENLQRIRSELILNRDILKTL